MFDPNILKSIEYQYLLDELENEFDNLNIEDK